MSDRPLLHFVEMESFTRSRAGVLTDDDLNRVTGELQNNPYVGDRIPGTGGVRKMRVARGGKGKRGGGRVLYFYFVHRQTIYFLYAYAKNAQEDISPAEKEVYRSLVDRIVEE